MDPSGCRPEILTTWMVTAGVASRRKLGPIQASATSTSGFWPTAHPLEQPHDAQDYLPLPLRQAHALAEYGVGGVISQSLYRLLVEKRLLNSPLLDSVLFKPELWREAHGLRYRPQLFVAGVLYSSFAQVSNVGAGHNTAGGLVEVLPAPPPAVRPAVAIQEAFELLRDGACHLRSLVLRSRWFNSRYHTAYRLPCATSGDRIDTLRGRCACTSAHVYSEPQHMVTGSLR